jgi:threonine synthase
MLWSLSYTFMNIICHMYTSSLIKGGLMERNFYQDTRGANENAVPFTQAVINGLAPGGGLYVPEEIPELTLDEICHLAQLPYAQRAAWIYKKFAVDLPDETIDALMSEAYSSNFDDEAICPITSLNSNTHVLELWHGPTSAFKDMALQCLPRFFSASAEALRERGTLDHEFMILVATSGDTGKAALEGFKNAPGVSIGVMYPHGGVSDIQYKQMATQRGNNVHVWGVRGNFDDCQTGAKQVFNDHEFAQELLDKFGIALSSANSINWGRLLPQIVYYVSAYAQLVADGKLEAGDDLDVCVPTGNFGNILAAYYAKRMGTPIRWLYCASNENRVLTDFINTGTYDISDRQFVLTPSPSMDILVSSNLERQLYELTGRNDEAIRGWMKDLREEKRFSVDQDTFARLQSLFAADSVDSATCLRTIKDFYEEFHYLVDPHTAVACRVASNLRDNTPVLIASTAHWAKFGNNVYRALHDIAPGEPLPDEVAALSGSELNRLIADETGCLRIPQGLAELDDLPIRFTEVIDGNQGAIEDAVCAFLSNLQKD